jgi:5-methylcytosine-specific restriction endonuclease McrA
MATSGLQSQAWRMLRVAVLDRDLWLCQIRGPGCTHGATEVDHIVARADGGAVLDPANCRAACAWCNRARGAGRTTQARRYRYRNTVADYVTRF